MTESLRVAIVGAGWAGLAAAVEATQQGHRVTLHEMATTVGGRARRLPSDSELGFALDNGQHILIGAYAATLGLMRTVGVDPDQVLLRQPLSLTHPDGSGLALPAGAPVVAFLRGVLGARGWTWGERGALLAASAGWAWRGFRCDPSLTVAQLCAGLPLKVRCRLVDPLCVAALNTPASQASATVFLRVLRDALFSGPGGADLLLPRADLGELLPDAAVAWLSQHGAYQQTGRRVTALSRNGPLWQVESGSGDPSSAEVFDRVILAASPTEAARLAAPHAPAWSETVASLRFEPIITVLLRAPAGTRLRQPMLMLEGGPGSPVEVLFDLGALRSQAEPALDGVLAGVVSGASAWVERGLSATGESARAQVSRALALDLTLLRSYAEKRATFLCLPGLARGGAQLAPGLLAAGDHVEGPYPSTLEGAVRSGIAAARLL